MFPTSSFLCVYIQGLESTWINTLVIYSTRRWLVINIMLGCIANFSLIARLKFLHDTNPNKPDNHLVFHGDSHFIVIILGNAVTNNGIKNGLKRHVACNYRPLKKIFSLFTWVILKYALALFSVNKMRSISRLHYKGIWQYFAPPGNWKQQNCICLSATGSKH